MRNDALCSHHNESKIHRIYRERSIYMYVLSTFVYIPIKMTAQWKDDKKQSVLIRIDSSVYNLFSLVFRFF